MDLKKSPRARAFLVSLTLIPTCGSAGTDSSDVRGLRGPGPIVVDWSPRAYGPDGPWHALPVSIGSPPQQVDLVPGHARGVLPLGNPDCAPNESCPSRKAGYYQPRLSNTVQKLDSDAAATIKRIAYGQGSGFLDGIRVTGSVIPVYDTLSIFSQHEKIGGPKIAIETLFQVLCTTTTTGHTYPITTGFFSIGAPAALSYLANNYTGDPPFMEQGLHQYLFRARKIPTPSFTMHIGSPALNITPSHILGGYDRSRLLGSVISQSLHGDGILRVVLTDISIGTEFGPSPFQFGSQSGLLTNHYQPTTNLAVNVELANPYLFLAEKTCENLALHLPITFNPDYGVYTWDTSDPTYKKIMKSPSWLQFTIQSYNYFQKLDQPVNIKVPIQLLSLTLEPPIATEPIAYFPCAPVNPANGDQFTLGKAFLQAATIGVNWNTSSDLNNDPIGFWYLGQAPGPDILEPQIFSIGMYNSFFLYNSSASEWERSWSKYWSSLDAKGLPPILPGPSWTPVPTTTPVTRSSGGLSTGLAAGIGVAAALVVILASAALGWCIFRRRRRNRSSPASRLPYNKEVSSPDWSNTQVQESAPDVRETQTGVYELPAPDSPASVDYFSGPAAQNSNIRPPQPIRPRTINTQLATVGANYDPDGIVSPISPSAPSPWSANSFGQTFHSPAQSPHPQSPPSHPPPSYPSEMEADRGAELEAPREVEKSGFLVC